MADSKESNDLPVSNTPLFAANEKIAKINVADEIKNSFLDARAVAVSRAQALQMRQDLRRHERQLPSARRSGDLSDARPHGAAVGDARAPRGRQRQFRLHRG